MGPTVRALWTRSPHSTQASRERPEGVARSPVDIMGETEDGPGLHLREARPKAGHPLAQHRHPFVHDGMVQVPMPHSMGTPRGKPPVLIDIRAPYLLDPGERPEE